MTNLRFVEMDMKINMKRLRIIGLLKFLFSYFLNNIYYSNNNICNEYYFIVLIE